MASLISSFSKLFSTDNTWEVYDNSSLTVKADLPEPYFGEIVTTKASDFIKQNNLPIEHYEFVRDFGGQSKLFCDYYKPFIAGGFFRRWVEGQPFVMKNYTYAGDIDVFSAYKKYSKWSDTDQTSQIFDFVKNTYDGKPKNPFDINKNGIIYTDTYTFQVMNMFFIKTYVDKMSEAIEENIKTMDASINMCGYDYNSDSFIHHSHFVTDIKDRLYRFNGTTRSFPSTAITRIEKFVKLGYSLHPDCTKDICKFMVRNADKINQDDHYFIT